MFIYSVCILFLAALTVVVTSITVITENGALSGTNFTTYRGRVVYAFLGVPYAKPPVNEYRFKEPQPVDNWAGIRPAHEFGSRCIQYRYHNLFPDPIEGDEDCLYVNIFTPVISSTSKLNVLVYIHGGAFMFGAGDIFTPDYILDQHDLVYVTMNYRLGPFGFLSTEDEIVPGNNGLKDQVLALKWIQTNIHHFGGDKDRVTIAGMSAGGASVHLHYFSPLSKDLFYQGISASGSAFNPWVLCENSRIKAQTLADSVGCLTNNTNLMIECMRQKSAKSFLLNTESLFLPFHFNPFSPFGVVIEVGSPTAFLSRNPYDLIKEGDIKDAPWLTSVTSEEGLYPGAFFVTDDELLKELDIEWNKKAPHLFDYNHTVPSQRLDEVSSKIRKFYLGDNNITMNQSTAFIKMLSDRLFVSGVELAARLQASVTSSPVYFYTFSYRGKYSLSEILCNCTDNLGASHADDIIYVLETAFKLSPLETEDDRSMVEVMVNVWTSFIEDDVPSANPDTVWPPLSPDVKTEGCFKHIHISSSKDLKLLCSEDLGNRKFWDSLPFRELWNIANEKRIYPDEL